jgi:hypothetical protein
VPVTEACGWDWTLRANTWFGIVTLFTAKFSPGGFELWAFVTGQLRHAHHGKMGIRNG